MPRHSNRFDELTFGHKSCFSCLNLKTKPFKINSSNPSELKHISVILEMNSNIASCSKNCWKDLNEKGEVNFIEKTSKGIVLKSMASSIKRYEKIAKLCGKYSGEILNNV